MEDFLQNINMLEAPFKWICSLTIESTTGKFHNETGFKIHIPDVNRSFIVTSAQNTFLDNSYAKKITARFPGKDPIEVTQDALYAAPEYTQKHCVGHDYGLILLPGQPDGHSDDGFGWSTIVPDNELDGLQVYFIGFYGEKPVEGNLAIQEAEIESYTANTISYKKGSSPGQNGGPCFTRCGNGSSGYWKVLAIKSRGATPANSSARFTVEMISRFLQRMDCLKPKAIQSVHFPGVYLRCDGKEVTKVTPGGSGTVNCQYTPPSLLESFKIIPVEMKPSDVAEQDYTVALESNQFNHVYVRMDGECCNAPYGPGGGEVNCQMSVSRKESFVMKKEQSGGGYSFCNVQFPHCYLRMDGTNVKVHTPSGAGVVNCQYYDTGVYPGPETYELYQLQDHK